eukprot:XP_016663810.1 PREDICTED: uncharacterized protein LOC103310664 [Acyrthosiphon pisum]
MVKLDRRSCVIVVLNLFFISFIFENERSPLLFATINTKYIRRAMSTFGKLDVNFASWGSTGGWKPNSLVYISNNACSNLKKVLGNVWYELVKGFNIPSTRCPMQVGTYITSGVDLEKLKDHNFPKVYFYGKYKMMVRIKNKQNTILGCGVMELSLIRPWENPT